MIYCWEIENSGLLSDYHHQVAHFVWADVPTEAQEYQKKSPSKTCPKLSSTSFPCIWRAKDARTALLLIFSCSDSLSTFSILCLGNLKTVEAIGLR